MKNLKSAYLSLMVFSTLSLYEFNAQAMQCKNMFSDMQARVATIFNVEATHVPVENILIGQVMQTDRVKSGFAQVHIYNQIYSDLHDYNEGMTIQINSSKVATPTRFDIHTRDKYYKDVQPWSKVELEQYYLYQSTVSRGDKVNFNAAAPKSINTDTEGNQIVTFSETNSALIPLAVRTVILKISPENKLLEVSIVSQFVRLNSNIQSGISSTLRIAIN